MSIKEIFVEAEEMSGVNLHRSLDRLLGCGVNDRSYRIIKARFNKKGAFVVVSQDK